MMTAAQQIGAYKRMSEIKPTEYDEALLLSLIETAERRSEQRVRAEIGRDSERLDWLCRMMRGSEARRLLGTIANTGDIDLWREAIDAAREVG